jgi:hypothetical protein
VKGGLDSPQKERARREEVTGVLLASLRQLPREVVESPSVSAPSRFKVAEFQLGPSRLQPAS